MVQSKLDEIKKLPLIEQVDKIAGHIDENQNRGAINDQSAFAFQLMGMYLELAELQEKSK